MKVLFVFISSLFFASALFAAEDLESPLDPVPARVASERVVARFDRESFEESLDRWELGPNVRLRFDGAALVVDSLGRDPYFFSPVFDGDYSGKFLVRFRARRSTTGFAQIFTSERDLLDLDETRSTRFAMSERGETREYSVAVETSSPLRRLRFDLGLDAGKIEIEWLEIVHLEFEPLKFGAHTVDDGALNVVLLNLSDDQERALVRSNDGSFSQRVEIAAQSGANISVPFARDVPYASLELVATSEISGATTRRRFCAVNEDALDRVGASNAVVLSSDKLEARFARDGSGAELVLRESGVRAVVLAPLLCDERLSSFGSLLCDSETDGEFVSLCADPRAEEDGALSYEIRQGSEPRGFLRFRLDDETLTFEIDSSVSVLAPVARVEGAMERAVLPGVEFLEKGERSSSSLDFAPKERARFTPEPIWTTAPFVAVETERASASLTYDPHEARVIFASPDFLDADEDSTRANVVASRTTGRLRVAAREPLEDSILRCVRELGRDGASGLPEPPKRPRSAEEQDALYLAAFESSQLKVDDGWALCVYSDERPERALYPTDLLSAIYRLAGSVPSTPRLDPGGTELRDYASFLLSGGAELMRDWIDGEAANIRKKQKPDGSFRYSGKYLRGSDVDYASGDCGNYLCRLLEHWRLTNDRRSLDAALRGLAFVNNLKTPRGAQTWELSLHTPDLLGASRCAWANVVAYEATNERAYLDAARRWAIDGLTFVYLWDARELLDASNDDERVMEYATIPVLGTTDWIAPCWLGTPVQWCGLDYARAVLALSRYDDALDWRRVAEGIVACAERQVYPSGKFIGLLPDSFDLVSQQRREANINPCALVHLRRQLDGLPCEVYCVDVAGRRVVSPYPARVEGASLIIDAEKDREYQLLIDGKEIKTVASHGRDVINF